MSRYLYEHLFLGYLYFESDTAAAAASASCAPPRRPASRSVPIATRRPYDDPGVARVYYRLVPERETIVAKTHMPYALGAARMAKYRAWFLDRCVHGDARCRRTTPRLSSNPFVAFSDLPARRRATASCSTRREYFIMNFIKGPVCRGQIALDVIEDRFWVFFVDPKAGDEASGRRAARARRRATCACPPNGAATRRR